MSERVTIGAIGLSGSGLQFAGRVLAEAAGSSGLSMALFSEPALQVRGDRSAFRLTLDTEPPMAPSRLDWLLVTGPVATDWEAGQVLFNSDRCPPSPGWGVPAVTLARQAGWPRGANLVLLGALASKLPWLTEAVVHRALKELLPDQHRQAAQNLACFRLGASQNA